MLAHETFRRTAVVALLGTAFCIQSASAHSPHDDIFDVHYSPSYSEDGRVYTIVRSLLLRSDDRGRTWKRLINGLDHKYMFNSLETSESDGNLYVTSLGDGIYRSRDDGEHWDRVNQGLTSLVVDRVVASPAEPGLVFATDVQGGFYRSDDAGGRWQRVEGDFGKVAAIAFFPSDGDQVVAGDHRGELYRSSDGGASWRSHSRFDGQEGITALAVAAAGSGSGTPVILAGTSGGRVLRSEDGGRSFTASKVTSGTQSIVSLGVSPEFAEEQLVFASVWDKGFHVSADGGRTWQTRMEGLSRNPQSAKLGRPSFSSLSVSPEFATDRSLLLAAYDGLFRSTDAGSTWEQLSTLSKMNIVALSAAPDAVEPAKLAVTTYLWGAFISPHDGSDWQPIYDNVMDPYAREEGLTRMFQIAFSPDYQHDRTLYTSTWYRFFRSTNGGGAWSKLSHKPAPPGGRSDQGSYYAISPNFREDQTLFVGLKSGRILKSVDRGESFSVVNNVGNMVGSLAVTPSYAEDQTIFAGDTRGVHVSRDGGSTWEFSRLVPSSFGSDLVAPAGYPDDFKDAWQDYLTTQREKEFEIKVSVSPDYANDQTVFAGTANGLYQTQNGGRTWHSAGTGSVVKDAFIEAVALSPDYSRDHTVLVSVRGTGLVRSKDSGKTFAPVAPDLIEQQRLLANYPGMTPKFPAIVFSPEYPSNDTVYGFSGTEVLRSQNQGKTWETLPTPGVSLAARAHAWSRYEWTQLSRRDKIFGAFAGLSFLVGTGYVGARKWKSQPVFRRISS